MESGCGRFQYQRSVVESNHRQNFMLNMFTTENTKRKRGLEWPIPFKLDDQVLLFRLTYPGSMWKRVFSIRLRQWDSNPRTDELSGKCVSHWSNSAARRNSIKLEKYFRGNKLSQSFASRNKIFYLQWLSIYESTEWEFYYYYFCNCFFTVNEAVKLQNYARNGYLNVSLNFAT